MPDRAPESITVVVVDDHPIVREGLARMLTEYPDIKIVGAAPTGADGLLTVERSHPQVVLLDMQLPDMHGLDVLQEIVRRHPESRVLVLTIHDEPAIASQALDMGAAGYVLKDASQEELIAAIRIVAVGGEYFTSLVMRQLIEDRSAREPSQLSAREKEVLRLLAEGSSNREIAEALFLSPETVKTYVARIFQKLEATDRAQAVTKAFRLGLIT